MGAAINTSPAKCQPIKCMQRSTFNPILRFWQDAAKTVPQPLAGSQFKLDVRDRVGNLIVRFSTAAADGSFTIQNTNELAFYSEMEVEFGTYKYDLEQTTPEDIILPLMYGDFIVQKKETQLV